jgi:D-psicose/D-tagatose/L-ribulose 3-epimerase
MTAAPITNPLGVHALVWVGDTAPASVRYAIEQTMAAGFDLLELSLHDADNLDVTAAAGQIAAAGLQVACSRGLSFTADVSSDDPAVVAKGEALLNESLDITHGLGGKILTGALYSALGKYRAPLTAAGGTMS